MNDFFKKTDLTRNEAEKIIDETLLNKDDGELYLQNSINENITLDDGKIKNTNFTKIHGMGLRGICEDVTAYCHTNSINKNSLNYYMQKPELLNSIYIKAINDLNEEKTTLNHP